MTSFFEQVSRYRFRQMTSLCCPSFNRNKESSNLKSSAKSLYYTCHVPGAKVNIKFFFKLMQNGQNFRYDMKIMNIIVFPCPFVTKILIYLFILIASYWKPFARHKYNKQKHKMSMEKRSSLISKSQTCAYFKFCDVAAQIDKQLHRKM